MKIITVFMIIYRQCGLTSNKYIDEKRILFFGEFVLNMGD